MRPCDLVEGDVRGSEDVVSSDGKAPGTGVGYVGEFHVWSIVDTGNLVNDASDRVIALSRKGQAFRRTGSVSERLRMAKCLCSAMPNRAAA